MSRVELAEILEKHVKWLHNEPGGECADLSSANLHRADLYRANLSSANLSRANLYRANLYSANLYSADLSRADLYSANLYSANLYRANLYRANLYSADLSRANLSSANLSSANLSRANLYRANLCGSCLAPATSPFDWAVAEGCEIRIVDNRPLVLASRTRAQSYMGGPSYEDGKFYRPPVFSRDPCSACHPGLYIEGGPECELSGARMLVACWLDEMFIVGKCRVPRFRTVARREDWLKLTAADMEEAD